MAHSPTTPPLLRPEFRKPLTAETAAVVIFKCAWRALTRAFLIQVLAGIAISLLSGVVSAMTPSLPPGVGHVPQVSALSAHHFGRKLLLANRFWILFAVLFGSMCVSQLVGSLRHPKNRRLAAQAIWVSRRIARGWFRIFVGNAFIAWLSATVLVLMQHFSLTQLLWSLACAMVEPVLRHVSLVLPGSGWLGSWYGWYGQNQTKLVFWLLYLAAICDDLGLPNYKTVVNSLRRRFSSRPALQCAPHRA